MTFKIIKRFETIVALIAGFAQGRTESADLFCMGRTTSRAFFGNVQMIFVISFFRRRNSINAKFLPRFIGDPVGGPNRRDFGNNLGLNSFFIKEFNNVFFNIEHCRTSRISRCNHDFNFMIGNHFCLPNNAEFHNIDDGNFGIGNLGKEF